LTIKSSFPTVFPKKTSTNQKSDIGVFNQVGFAVS